MSPMEEGWAAPDTPGQVSQGRYPRALYLQDIPGHVRGVRNPKGDPGALRFDGSSRLHLGTPGSELHNSHSAHTPVLQQGSSQQPRGHCKPGQWASPPSIKHLLTTPPNPVSLPSRAPGQRHGTALPPPLPSFFTAHLIGPVPTGVAVGGHDNHFLKVWDFWSEESRETSKQQQRDGMTPLGVVSSPETALHPNRSHLREPRAMQCPPSPRAEPSLCPPLKDTH